MDPSDDNALEEKRATARVQPFVVHCGISDGPRHLSAYLTELSTGGARVACPHPAPAEGAQLMLEVRFSGRLESVKLPARVAWVDRRGGEKADTSFGVRFDGLAPEHREVLDTVLGEFRRMAALIERPQRRTWTEGPEPVAPGDDWRGLDDDELLFRVAALDDGHERDDDLMSIVDSERHFFIRQEAAKRIQNPDLLKKHAGDRHIGQILARVMTRDEDEAYLQKLVKETRHLEVRKAAQAQLIKMAEARKQKGG